MLKPTFSHSASLVVLLQDSHLAADGREAILAPSARCPYLRVESLPWCKDPSRRLLLSVLGVDVWRKRLFASDNAGWWFPDRPFLPQQTIL